MKYGFPNHVAVIMDGNGRWARRRGLPRPAGHRAGARAVRLIVEHAARSGIAHLTLFAFSQDNWKRDSYEVAALMTLLQRYLSTEIPRCQANGIALRVIGRRDRFSPDLQHAIVDAEQKTRGGTAMTLRLAVDYSSRWAIRQAAPAVAAGWPLPAALARAMNTAGVVPAVDLLIRSGGEQRLSDFLLLECAYAELFFTPLLWPDFRPAHLDQALKAFTNRVRRYGACPEADKPHKEVRYGSLLDSP